MSPKEVYDERQRARKAADMQQEKNREEREVQEAKFLELSKKTLNIFEELLDGVAFIQVHKLGNGDIHIRIKSSATRITNES